jgi:hypothetical protein
LLEHGPDGLVLEVGGVAVLVEDALHHHADLGLGALAEGPVDRYALADLGDQLGGDQLELGVAHRLDGGVVGGEGVVEGDLVVGQAELFAALAGGVHLFGERISSSITSWVAMARLW